LGIRNDKRDDSTRHTTTRTRYNLRRGGTYIPNGSRRRYRGSVHVIGANRMLGGGKVVEKQYHPEGVEDKASWE